ncbi:hypothetical protein [Jeotgalibacillus sp. R-1-5s-1]|uniref:hypothetical protein n=1 Tax=Jeotgalibacillus sp. R-1-5s-1 TaxID=2555897 RepID=UPI00106AD1F2|nr:hypothetical protein [Jeotgalibacillus sp. R-1-5s-1]TFD97061.1 hypothetical protein E2491_10235 [Jeotgalibacillus sp. R-1-5s-1]
MIVEKYRLHNGCRDRVDLRGYEKEIKKSVDLICVTRGFHVEIDVYEKFYQIKTERKLDHGTKSLIGKEIVKNSSELNALKKGQRNGNTLFEHF